MAMTGRERLSGGDHTAEGVVVAVVVVLAIIGCVIFFVRRRRNAQIEEEHRRNAAVSSFIGSGKPPSSSADSRLDQSLAHRRMSDGSIADNQDYSRKILRVCTPSEDQTPSPHHSSINC